MTQDRLIRESRLAFRESEALARQVLDLYERNKIPRAGSYKDLVKMVGLSVTMAQKVVHFAELFEAFKAGELE